MTHTQRNRGMMMNAVKQVKKSENIGVTFDGLIATAFPKAKRISFEIIPGFHGCGTAHVDGVATTTLTTATTLIF